MNRFNFGLLAATLVAAMALPATPSLAKTDRVRKLGRARARIMVVL
jgi:hypothetical protein